MPPQPTEITITIDTSTLDALELLVRQMRRQIRGPRRRQGAQSQTDLSERQLSLPLSEMTDQCRDGE